MIDDDEPHDHEWEHGYKPVISPQLAAMVRRDGRLYPRRGVRMGVHVLSDTQMHTQHQF